MGVRTSGQERPDGSSGWRRSSDGTRVGGHVFQQSSFATHTLAVIASALDALAMTGTVVMAGSAPAGTRTSLDMQALLNGRAVRGTIQGDSAARQLVPHLIELHRQGRFPVDRLVRGYRFGEIRRAIADMENGQVIKPILRMDE
jgi:aryl-alcohol dehydrogenase